MTPSTCDDDHLNTGPSPGTVKDRPDGNTEKRTAFYPEGNMFHDLFASFFCSSLLRFNYTVIDIAASIRLWITCIQASDHVIAYPHTTFQT